LVFLAVAGGLVHTRFVALAAALAGLAAAAAALPAWSRAWPLRYFVLGLWAISITWAAYDIGAIEVDGEGGAGAVSIPGYTSLASPSVRPALAIAVIAMAATALLLVAVGRSAGRVRVPGSLGLALLAVVGAGSGAWARIVYSRDYWDTYYAPAGPREAAAGISVAVAVAVAWYALTLRDRLLGGALLLGWYTTMTVGFLAYFTAYLGHHVLLPGVQLAGAHILVAALIAAGIALTVIYMRRRRAAAPVG
jgi:hypothetical protein